MSRPQEVFFDDFSSYGQGQEAPFGQWKLVRGKAHVEEMVQRDGTIGKALKTTDDPTVLMVPGEWKDMVLTADLKPVMKGYSEMALYFRLARDGNKGYYVKRYLSNVGTLKLYKFSGSTEAKIAESSRLPALEGDDWHTLRVDAIGARIRIYVDGAKVIDVTDKDPSLAYGGIGVGSLYAGSYVDNVRLKVSK